jgi:hypothetical protein
MNQQIQIAEDKTLACGIEYCVLITIEIIYKWRYNTNNERELE